jgi:hypothetical protein
MFVVHYSAHVAPSFARLRLRTLRVCILAPKCFCSLAPWPLLARGAGFGHDESAPRPRGRERHRLEGVLVYPLLPASPFRAGARDVLVIRLFDARGRSGFASVRCIAP